MEQWDKNGNYFTLQIQIENRLNKKAQFIIIMQRFKDIKTNYFVYFYMFFVCSITFTNDKVSHIFEYMYDLLTTNIHWQQYASLGISLIPVCIEN